MTKKFVKNVWMALTAAGFVIAGAAPARADQTIVARVPFDFVVGDSRMPAGAYVVRETSDPSILSIASRDGRYFAFVQTLSAPSDQGAPLPELVFEQFGGQRFLARVVPDGYGAREIVLKPALIQRESDVSRSR